MNTMFKKLSFNIRSNILLVITGLVVSYVQLFIHHKKYLWDTFGDFFFDFIVSYIFVGIFCVISGVIIKITGKYFLPKMVTDNPYGIDIIIFYVCMYGSYSVKYFNLYLGIRISFQD